MINKQDFIEIEEQLDEFANQRRLNSNEAKKVIDKYFDLIIQFFKEINEIETIDFKLLGQYPVVPMNFEERYQYMLARKYHFMGYSQMKTLKSELIKMNASYQIRRKRLD
ncbi:YpoC family protein [Staphylococcus borealis]